MEKVPSLQVIWEKQVQAAVKIHLYPWGQLLPKPERQWVFSWTLRGNPVLCFLTVNVLLLSLFSPLKVLYPRCLQTLMNRSLIFLSKSSILHLTIEYLYVPGSNKRFLALILLPDENGVTTGNTWISQQYSMSIIQKWTHFSPSILSLPSISCLRPAWRLDTWRPFILCVHLYFMHAVQKDHWSFCSVSLQRVHLGLRSAALFLPSLPISCLLVI